MKLRKRIAAIGAAMVMAITGMAMNVSAANYDTDYSKTLTPLCYAPYSTIHTSDSVSVKLRVASGSIMFNTTVNITGSGQLNVSSATSNISGSLTIKKTGNYQIQYVGSQAGSWKTINYSLSNYGTYSTIYVSGNANN